MLLCLLTACHHHHDDPEPEPSAQTILYYFPWSGDAKGNYGLYGDFQNNIREIESAIVSRGTMANARLLVCMANKPHDASLYEIKLENGRTWRDTLTTYSNIDFTKKETVLRFINDTKAYAPSLRYALMVGCHGMGWLPVDDESNAKADKARRKYFGGGIGFRAEIAILADAINESNTHLDFILFDDCYMANVEVVYDLHHITDYLIASTSEIMARGMPYEEMWQYLSPIPNYEMVCNTYIDFYSDLIRAEGCEVEVIFGNKVTTLLDYTDAVLTCDIHTRERSKRLLRQAGVKVVLGLDDILCSSVDGSGYNDEYGLLGSNKATEETVKLLDRKSVV